MTDKDVKEYVKQSMIDNIQKIITGEIPDDVWLLYCKPSDVIEYFESIGGKELPELFSTNGLHWDYWFYVELNGIVYRGGGTGYYGDSIGFGINTE